MSSQDKTIKDVPQGNPNANGNGDNKPKPRVNKFFVGQKHYETTKDSLTVREILVDFAGVDPATKTLALKQGGGFHEYKDLNEEISVEHPQHFILFDNASTPVS